MRTILAGERYRELLEAALMKYGYEVIWLHDNPLIDPRLAGHADLNAFTGRKKLYISSHICQDTYIVNQLTNKRVQVDAVSVAGMYYPDDAALCAAEIGGRLYHKPSITAPALLEAYNDNVVSVHQGYARCAVCSVTADALITADAGIARAAKIYGNDVLLISGKGFYLEGYAEGFIGGSSFTDYDRKTVFFTGNLEQCPQKAEILKFIASHGAKAAFLTDHAAFDIGSAVLL